MNVFELFAKIGLDTSEYEKELKGAESKLSAVGGKLGAMGSKIASGIGTAMKVGAAAVGAASTAVGALATKSVTAYADYEQMVGGIQKLYGNMGQSLEEYAKAQGKSVDEVRDEWTKLDEAQNLVLKNAQNAYKTAGMSANQYMEIATSFSASLINSLGGDSLKAADATDKAMRAISDNWNTFGGDIGMIQGAFQGFAKGNYTMLDNLKLGYGGTKEEMKKLIDDANEYAKTIGEASDLSMDSFADIVTAIDLIQQKQNIAGTTAREASTTISGSLGMAKAAWENLVTGMSDSEADLDGLMNNLVDSITGYTDEAGEHVNGVIDNILPVAEKALGSVGTLIEKLAPVIGEQLPGLVESIFPSLLSAGANIVSSLVQGITENLPQLLFTAGDMIESLLNGLLEATSSGESTIMGIIDTILGVFEENYMTFMDMGMQILENILNGMINSLPDTIYYITEILNHWMQVLIDNAPILIQSGFELIKTLALGIAQALPELIPKVVEIIITIVTSLIDNIDLLIDAAIALITGLAEGIINALPILIEKAPEIIIKLVEAILTNLPKILEAAIQLVVMLATGIIQAIPHAVNALLNLIQMLFTTIKQKLPEFLARGKELIQKLADGIRNIKSAAANAMSDVMAAIKNKVSEWFGKAKEWGKDLINNFVQGIKDNIGKVVEQAKALGQTVKDYIGFSEPEKGPLSDFHTFAPDMLELFAQGIRDNISIITDQMEKSFNFSDAMTPPVASRSTASTGGTQYIPFLDDIIDLLTDIRDNAGGRGQGTDYDLIYRQMQRKNQQWIETTGVSGL